MSYAIAIAKNASAKLIATVVTMASSAVFVVIATRYLGDAAYGRLTFALSFTAIFSVWSDLGINILAVKEVSPRHERSKDYLSTIFAFRGLLGFTIFAITTISIILTDYSPALKGVTIIIAIMALFNTLSSSLRWIFQAFQRLEFDAFLDCGKGILTIALGWGILASGYGVLGVSWMMVIVSILVYAIAHHFVRTRFSSFFFRIDKDIIKEIAKSGYPLALMAIFASIYCNIGVVILPKYADESAVGWYGAANKLITVVTSITTILTPALFPVLAETYNHSLESFKKIYAKFFDFFLLLGIGVAMPLALLSDEIVGLIFGKAFINSGPVLQILAWSSVAILVSQIVGFGLIGSGHQGINALICGIGLLTNLLANFLLTPTYHHLGVAWSTFLTETVISFGAIVASWKLNILRIKPNFLPRLFAVVIIYYSILQLLKSVHAFYLLPLSLVGYIGAVVIFGFLTKNDLETLGTVARHFLMKIVKSHEVCT